MRYLLFLLGGMLLLVILGGQKSNFLMIKWHWAAINHLENFVLLSFEVWYYLLDHFKFIVYWILNEVLTLSLQTLTITYNCMITVSIYIFYIFTHGMYLVFQSSFSIKAVKMVDDEVQGFHYSDIDEQRCYWVRKMIYSKMMLKCCCCTVGSMYKMHGLCKLCEF